MAISLHVQGTVVLRATVLRNGRLSMIHVISGNDLLVPAALHAVQQWRYKPAELDGKPVETDTTIKVSFALAR
jgi:protein TonB